MFTLNHITSSSAPELREVIDLFHSAFPREERRDDDAWLALIDNGGAFRVYRVDDGGQMVAFVTIWNFSDVAYIEHFAVAESMRGCGIGHSVLRTVLDMVKIPVALEVEMPALAVDDSDRTLREARIRFYRSLGFEVSEIEYRQPPYRSGDDFIPMHLMYHGTQINLPHTITQIHHNVYGVSTK